MQRFKCRSRFKLCAQIVSQKPALAVQESHNNDTVIFGICSRGRMTERKELIDMLRYQTPLRVWFSDCEKYAYASAKNGCVIKVDADVAPLLHFCRPYVKARKYPNRTINYVTLSFGRATKYLHRVITCCPDDCEVDHKNGDTLDNTRENLRVVTHQENMQNPHSRRSSMTPMGVSLLPSGRFRAVRRIRGVTKHLGVFDTLDDALQAYEQAKGE